MHARSEARAPGLVPERGRVAVTDHLQGDVDVLAGRARVEHAVDELVARCERPGAQKEAATQVGGGGHAAALRPQGHVAERPAAGREIRPGPMLELLPFRARQVTCEAVKPAAELAERDPVRRVKVDHGQVAQLRVIRPLHGTGQVHRRLHDGDALPRALDVDERPHRQRPAVQVVDSGLDLDEVGVGGGGPGDVREGAPQAPPARHRIRGNRAHHLGADESDGLGDGVRRGQQCRSDEQQRADVEPGSVHESSLSQR